MNKFVASSEIIHPVTESQRVKERGELLIHRVTLSLLDECIYCIVKNYSPCDAKSSGERSWRVAYSPGDFEFT